MRTNPTGLLSFAISHFLISKHPDSGKNNSVRQCPTSDNVRQANIYYFAIILYYCTKVPDLPIYEKLIAKIINISISIDFHGFTDLQGFVNYLESN